MFKKLYRRYLLRKYQRLFERLYFERMKTNTYNALEFAKIDFEWITGVEWMVCFYQLADEWAAIFGTPPYQSANDGADKQQE